MKRQHYSSPYQKSRSYSPVVVTEGGRTVWLAGLLAPEDESGKSLAGDFEAQVRCVFRKMAKQLETVGATMNDVVSMTCFITEVRYNLNFVELRKEFFHEDSYPASTLVTVAALNRPEAMVEVQAVAVME